MRRIRQVLYVGRWGGNNGKERRVDKQAYHGSSVYNGAIYLSEYYSISVAFYVFATISFIFEAILCSFYQCVHDFVDNADNEATNS